MSHHSVARARFGLRGPEGLLLGIMAQAFVDLHSTSETLRLDALSYFHSAWYRSHLNALGLPPDWKPEGANLRFRHFRQSQPALAGD